jgi:LPS O-antigen subunit length determinant protein (WzzB/FepE family)
MEQWIPPEAVWANGITPVIVVVLLATGVLVTRREHSNMVKLMEYFRELAEKREKVSENKDATIRDLTEAVKAFKETAKVTKATVETVRDIAQSSTEDG